MPRTSQQHTFVERVHGEPKQSFILQALAGTGKTTTLLDACPEDATLAVAFNKRIQKELESKFPPNADCMTFNGLGHRTWQKYLSRRPAVDSGKAYRICRAIAEEMEEERIWKNLSELMTLLNTARQTGLVHAKIQQSHTVIPLITDDPAIWYAMCEDADLPEFLIEPARQALYQCTLTALKADIDFLDQLYMPVVFRAPFPRGKYANLIVDEAQDLGPLEHAMIELSLGKNGRLIAAGDHHQAIYGWRGAHSDSMFRLQEKTSAEELPLTITFRCPRAVVKEANRIVPEFEAAPEAPDGLVERWNSNWIPGDLSCWGLGNTAILCRNNKPLFKLAMQLIKGKVSCRMEGRDIGKNIKRIVQDVTHGETVPSAKLIGLVDTWMNDKRERYLAKGDFPKVAKVEDQAASIIAVAEECSDSGAVVKIIDDLFGRHSAGITLSTIHKAKGLEWQNVFILNEDLIGKHASAEWAKEQEENLRYVAITRAMQRLVYIEQE